MTVLIVSHLLSRGSGGGVMMRSLAVARALAREGVDVRLLGTDAGMIPADAAHLSDVRVSLVRSVSSRFVVPLPIPGTISRLVREADVVLLFNHWTMLNLLVYRAARRHDVPHVVCPSGALTLGARSHGIKRVYNATAGRRLVHDAARWVATTELERGDFAGYGVNADRVDVIPNAVDAVDDMDDGDAGRHAADVARLRESLALGDAPVILFMGRLNTVKGPDLLLEAFGRIAAGHPRYRLVFAGRDEGMMPALTARASALGLRDRVHLIGHLDRVDSATAYRMASLLVVPSRQEAMSLVALEAAAAATPVMMTDVCGFDVARAGGGLVVPPTVDGIAEGLGHLLSREIDLPGMGAALRAHVMATYGWSVVAPRWVEVLTGAAGTRHRYAARGSVREAR
jgi:glycosyltransferase involved in cell wall biosynthesis